MRVLVYLAMSGAASCAVASCRSEDLRTTFVQLTGPDGGTLSGFNCIEDEVSSVRPCIEACYRGCMDGCRAAATEARDAGTPAAIVLAQTLACTQDCFSEETACADACTPSSASAAGRPLTARANGKPVCVAVDFLRVGGEIECRSAGGLIEWCTAQPDQCGVLQRSVHCVEPLLAVPVDAGMEAASVVVDANFARMHAEIRANLALLAESAPEEWVMVRMMATSQDAPALEDTRATDLQQVVGCSLSCPTLLSTRDTLTLELDEGRLGYCRAGAVRACAAIGTPQLSAAYEQLGF